MGVWVHLVTFIGVAFIISCEATSPKRPIIDDSTGDNDESDSDSYPTCGANEVYDICPRLCPPRRCDVDERIIRCGENPKPGDPKCEPGCRCADNYYRNNEGDCVTKKECPKCFQKNEVYACRRSDPQTCETIDEECEPIKNKKHCKRECRCKDGFYRNKIGECISKKNCLKCSGPHEYFSCGGACDNVCSTLHLQNQTSCPIVNIVCNKMCYCEEGYARDENNICVPIEDCPPICPVNEVYDICPRVCPPRICGADKQIYHCPRIPEPGDPRCKPGCRCADNYYRNNDGVCVTKKECSKCTQKNEVYTCRSSNPQTCETIGEDYGPIKETKHCKRECRCKKGYYRNKLGECISKKNCLKCSGPHEYFSCGGACDNVCSNLHLQNQTSCPIQTYACNKMCYCEKGYARDENNICVPIEDCPPICPVNEVYDICPRLCPPRRCDVDERIIRCARNPEPGDPKCKPGCRCADNYYRNNDGVCVTKKECPKCKRKNEEYTCRSSNPQTCDTIGEDYDPIKETKHCKRECRCKKGYYRNKLGECISKKNCLKCSGPHEYFSCGGACDNVCSNLHLQNQTSCPIVNIACNKMCYCEEGYARDENNICVPIEDCPPICPVNEVYDICPRLCPTRTCGIFKRLYKCPKNPQPGDPECKPGCRCADNYYRNKDGVCVTEKECPKCMGENEVYTCRSSNPQTCETIDEDYGPIKETKHCKRECRCKKGYYRNKLGECISKKNCLKCSGPHEYFSCGGACDNVCSTLHLQNQTSCPIVNIVCNKMCYCEEGYARDENNICVPIEDCPPVCPVNEVYDICPRLCPPRICGVDKRQYKCAKSPEPGDPRCKPGCRCADNFYRNKDGVCVTKKECQKCTGKNEVYECRSSKPQTCETIDDDYEPIKQTKNCKPVCQCKEGYYRNKIGECISKENCLKCNGPHEYFTCGSACDNVCATLQTQNQTNCLIKNKTCNKKCYCEEGYARDKNNICVPIEKCPPICGKNEVYDICLPTCPPQRCDVNIAAISCAPNPMPGDPDCIPGCRCADDHVRNDAGICIPRDECPTCGVNEVYDICPALCPPRSCDVDDRTIDCAPNPLPGDPECNPGCRCADNYYRNDVGVCVTREECPLLIECGKNEIASRCANGGCRKLSCAVPEIVCAKIPIGYCQEGCVCEENYLRADNGTCVLESECPPVCGLHEVYDECPPTCPPQRCDVDNRLIKCRRTPMPGDPECQPGCRCEDDYYRNENGVCVTRDECPPLIQCGENEFASSCANGGCRKVSCARPQIRCVKLKEGGCKEGCLCIDNYLRAENGTCIPEEECPPVCGINEVYDICPPICPQARCDVDKSLILCKPNPEPGDPECNPGCRCADNFYKNNEGVCVPWDECPPPIECGLNEEYSTCANGGCRRYSCNMTGILCIDLKEGGCRSGCICKDQYTRSDDGICIPEKECPKICGPNEEYRCDNTCSKTCNIVDGKCAPPVKSKICKLECYCKDGYKRNKKGKCVTECDDVTEETTDGLTAFEQGNIEFTEQFLITSSKNNPNESVIGSPFSVLFLLAQLALYAVGEAKTQLLNLLHLNNDCEIRTTVPKYFKLIAETNNASFDLAQKIYGSDKYPFSKKFKKDSGEIFNAEAQNVDFAKPEEAAAIINKWVAEKTHNLINNLVSPDSLSADTRLVLAIAIYFIGDWKRQFKASNTRSLPFYSGKTNDEVQVKMMNQVGSFKYAVIDGVQVLQMPYTVPDISFVACLPKSKTGVKKLIKKLKKSSFIKRTLSELKSTTVDVSIPTLDISTTTDLKQVLIDAGVDAIFDPATAGLSGILENPEEIFVTSAVQKAKLLLNETGTQAAAATAITVGITSVAEPVVLPAKFNADHPFIYYIVYKNLLVFAGTYFGPQ